MDSGSFIARLDVLIIIDVAFYILHRWIERRQFTIDITPTLSKIVNLYYSVWSLLWLMACLYALPISEWIFNPQQLCSPVPNNSLVDILFFGYYISKFHEYSDVILILLAPRKFPLHPHFRYHHLTTPFFAYYFLHYQCGHHAVFMVANLFMHAVVYFYFAGFRTRLLFWMCRVWGHVQLFLGIGVALYSFLGRLANTGCSCGSIWSDLVPLGLYLMYFALYQYELYWPWPPEQKNKKK
jgi:hypothetical protein